MPEMVHWAEMHRLHRDLYEEHLEEASFLTEQHCQLRFDLEMGWRDLGEWEERIEAHLDALVVGGNAALQVCMERAVEGDSWESAAALRVMCRQNRKDLVFEWLRQHDPDDKERVAAVADALRVELPTTWQRDIASALSSASTEASALLILICGYRRFPFKELYLQRLAEAGAAEKRAAGWALGRLGDKDAIASLRLLTQEEDGGVRDSVATALLRLGDDWPLRRGMIAARYERWARRALAIAGSRKAVSTLLDSARGKDVDSDTVLFLGLLGDVAAVAQLVALLEHEELGESAAIALNTLTGAGLYTEVFIADEFDENELFEEERQAFVVNKTLPARHDDRPYGNWEYRPMRDAEAWKRWLAEHRGGFDRERRWRHGMPYGPVSLAMCLQSDATPNVIRELTCEELVCRYGLPVPFEYDLPAARQELFLDKIMHWAQQATSEYESGGWTFAGQPQT